MFNVKLRIAMINVLSAMLLILELNHLMVILMENVYVKMDIIKKI